MTKPPPNPARTEPDASAGRLVLDVLGTGGPSPARGSWEAALPLLASHGLEGLALDRADAWRVRVPAEARAVLEPAARRTALETTLVLEAGRRARRALEEAGVRTLLFKGAALVEGGLYGGPGSRRMDDADLLVPAAAATAAVAALRGAGFVPWSPWSPDRTGWLDSATFTDPEAPPALPVAVDLHWRVGYGGLRFGGGEDGLAWRGADERTGLPGHEAHLLLVAEHLLKHLRVQAHVVAYADLARLVERVERWDDVVAWGRGRAQATAVADVLRALREELGAPVPEEVPSALAGGRLGAVPAAVRPSALLGHRAPVEGRAAGLLLRWRLLGGPRAVLRDLAQAAFPAGAWLRARYGEEARTTPGRWLRYLLHVGRWITGRARSPASPNQELLDASPSPGGPSPEGPSRGSPRR